MTDSTSSILLRQAGSTEWSAPEVAAYDDEAHLQSLLAVDPVRIPGVMEGAAAVQELSTSAGPIDICAVSLDGSITVVECKLKKNSEKRRMVVGQVIDYASALRADGIKAFRQTWSARGGAPLDEFLDADAAVALEENLAHGRINMCLAVDQIDDDLRRLVEYLNLVTADEVMVTALQLTYARHGSVEILVPSTFGAEIAASKSAGRPKGEAWTWETFLADLADDADRAIALDLIARMEAISGAAGRPRYWFGARGQGVIVFKVHGNRYGPFCVWQNAGGQLQVFGNWRRWNVLQNDERFARLATVMGQSHLDATSAVPARQLDLDAFWAAAVECDQMINAPTA